MCGVRRGPPGSGTKSVTTITRIERGERTDHRSVHHRQPEPEHGAGNRRPRAPRAAARDRSPAGRDATIEVARPRRREHEQHRVGGAGFRREDGRQRERAEDRRQCARHRGEREVRADVGIEHARRHADERRQRGKRPAARRRSARCRSSPRVVARAERLLHQARRDDERRAEEEEQSPPGLRRAAGEEIQARGIGWRSQPIRRRAPSPSAPRARTRPA